MLVTDSQVHIWEVDRPDRRWPQPVRNEPQRPNGWSAEEMLAEMDKAGVDRAVIVPPTWVGENNATALEAAAKYPRRFAVMGRFDPTAADSRERLEAWRSQPGMLGIRMTFRVQPFATWLEDGTLDWFWRDAERLGIPVMVLLAGMPEKAQPIARRHPGLTLIIDHMAADLTGGADAFASLGELVRLAALPKVSVKVSSAPNFSKEPYPYRDLLPVLRRIYDAFGARRMHWGADITRVASTYSECLRHFQEGIDFLTASDREQIVGKSLAEAVNWPEDGST